MSDYKDTFEQRKAFCQPFKSLEKVFLTHGSISLCEILNIWNTILTLVHYKDIDCYSTWDSIMAKLRYIQIQLRFIGTKKHWNLFCVKCKQNLLSKIVPLSLKELLLIVPEIVDQHLMSSVVFSVNKNNKLHFTSSIFDIGFMNKVLCSKILSRFKVKPCTMMDITSKNVNLSLYLELFNALQFDGISVTGCWV